MEPFDTERGVAAVLDRSNVDTDAIIPKQFLKSIQRTGFGVSLFFDWRYGPDGQPDPAFLLNQPPYQGARILVAGNNFGCGSSREHAVWAIRQYGFRVVIAPWHDRGGDRVPAFADIFRNNCVKNGVLTIELPQEEVRAIMDAVLEAPGTEATVDLPSQTVVVHGREEQTFRFDIDPSVKEYLLRGLDDIGLTLNNEDDIAAFERDHDTQLRVP